MQPTEVTSPRIMQSGAYKSKGGKTDGKQTF
nr:MAG TPA: hypothetical protein [Caudoviricetes sp.]